MRFLFRTHLWSAGLLLCSAASAQYTITEYGLKPGSVPYQIAAGPDGALWFTEAGSLRIGRITTAGVITEYPTGTFDVGSHPSEIAAGPDGAMWFIESQGDGLYRITTAGVTTMVAQPLLTPFGKVKVGGIAAGPDGAMWYTGTSRRLVNSIARIVAGVSYPFISTVGPGAIAAGPDGAMWFTEFGYGASWWGIGRVTMAGELTEYQLKDTSGATAIAGGPDGAVWFIIQEEDLIGRITTAGVITLYSVQGRPSGILPTRIAAGPDGACGSLKWAVTGSGVSLRPALSPNTPLA